MINKAIVVGHVGKDPEIRTMQSGGKIASFSVATSERWRDRNTGERKEKTDWHNVVCFNEHLIPLIEAGVRKGARVYVEGKMQTRKYQDRAGVDRYTTEIVLSGFHSQVQLLDKRERGPSSEDDYGTPSTRSPERTRAEMDDEIPF